jgi:beta-glucuronidase
MAQISWAGKSSQYPSTRAEVVPSKDRLILAFPGVKGPIPYEQFGEFQAVGTKEYKYVIKDKKGLAKAAGEGIFPNTEVFKDPAYQQLLKEGALEGSHWKFVDTPTAAKNFYKWATTAEDPGVKQFYAAILLERAGYIEESIKALYAIAVHFPKTLSYTYYKTPWYVAPSAMDRMVQLLRRHPNILMELQGGKITVKGKFDTDTKNDEFVIDPGKLVAVKKRVAEKPLDLSRMKVIKIVGGPNVQLKQYENHHWQLLVGRKPFPIKAITYHVAPVGVSPDRGTWVVHKDWQMLDTNKNGLLDGLDESFIDKNGNGVQKFWKTWV